MRRRRRQHERQTTATSPPTTHPAAQSPRKYTAELLTSLKIIPCYCFHFPLSEAHKIAADHENHSATAADTHPIEPSPQEFREQTPFYPVISRYASHDAYNILPSRLRFMPSLEPNMIFGLFLPPTLLETIAENTNSYHAIHAPAEEGKSERRWADLSGVELGQWIGIVIYMGVVKLPALADYWCRHDISPVHRICDYMTQTWFGQIRRYLHVSAPAHGDVAAPENSGWHSKVDPLLNHLRYSSQRFRMPSTHIAIDEAMIRCTGRSSDTYKMPSKPIEQGFKFHCLGDHGYIWDFHPTSNRSGLDPVRHIPGLTSTGDIVYHLLNKLPRTRQWVAYLDNFYTTLPLVGRLRHDLSMGTCGTTRPPSAGVPAELKIPKKYFTRYDLSSGFPTFRLLSSEIWILSWILSFRILASELPRSSF